jgi:hypothetical protein
VEGLSFLLKQLFFSFFAGCIVDGYLIIYHFTIRDVELA